MTCAKKCGTASLRNGYRNVVEQSRTFSRADRADSDLRK